MKARVWPRAVAHCLMRDTPRPGHARRRAPGPPRQPRREYSAGCLSAAAPPATTPCTPAATAAHGPTRIPHAHQCCTSGTTCVAQKHCHAMPPPRSLHGRQQVTPHPPSLPRHPHSSGLESPRVLVGYTGGIRLHLPWQRPKADVPRSSHVDQGIPGTTLVCSVIVQDSLREQLSISCAARYCPHACQILHEGCTGVCDSTGISALHIEPR